MQVKLDFSILDDSELSETDQKTRQLYYKLEADEKIRVLMEEASSKQLEVYAAHQEAIIKAGELTSEITKGIQVGERPENLLLKAIKCISLITGDSVFYELNKKNIKNTYEIELAEDIGEMESINGEELEKFLNDD